MQKPFQGLRWKLTLSYTLVTVTTLTVVLIFAAIGVWFVLANSNISEIVFISLVKSFIVPPVASYLDHPQPDVQGLKSWLRTARDSDGLSFQSPIYPNIRATIDDTEMNIILLVLDENLDYLAGLPELDEDTLKSLLNEADGVLAAAQAGEENPERISQITPDQVMTFALPVTGNNGTLLGMVVFRGSSPMNALLKQFISYTGMSIIIFILVAGIVGTVFGYFTARGLTRRLHNMARATDAWSQGDFSHFIYDRSVDELGQLVYRLNRMAEQLQNLIHTRQELAALEERNRLAHDLHDSVKQQVFAASMQVGAARALLDRDSEAAREHLNEAEHLSRQAQSELATIIRELRPATLQGKGVTQALKEYVADWSRQNMIATEVRIRDERTLPVEVEQALFRIAQEALSNIARHSQATHVEIQLDWNDEEVSMTISDNGIGFDVSAAEGKGVGLRSMRERIEALGGSLSLESKPGDGTRLITQCKVTTGMSV